MKTVNEVKRAYTFYLKLKLGKLYAQMLNKSVSLDAMKKNVKNYIFDAGYSYKQNGKTCFTEKKWFIETLNNLETKQQVYLFCLNSVKKAQETIAR